MTVDEGAWMGSLDQPSHGFTVQRLLGLGKPFVDGGWGINGCDGLLMHAVCAGGGNVVRNILLWGKK